MTSSLKLFLILYYIKQIDSKLLCVCSVIDHRGHQNVVRTSVTHSAAPRLPIFCSYHILTSSVTYYWKDAWQLGIYLISWCCILDCSCASIEIVPLKLCTMLGHYSKSDLLNITLDHMAHSGKINDEKSRTK